MKKNKKKYAICPCCLTPTHRTEMAVCISLLETWERKVYRQDNDLNLDAYNTFIDSSFEWACDACLRNGKAITASPALQKTGGDPNIAYYDASLICRNCGKDFRFTKEEKKLWYEKFKFWTECTAVNCLQCRRQIREFKSDNKILSDILRKDHNGITKEELQTAADIYRKWGKPDKAKLYEAILRKKA
jgi:hypothetical protein